MKPSELMRRYNSTANTLQGRRGDVMAVMSTLRKYGLGPKAARTDVGPASPPIVCDEHDEDLADCQRAGRIGCVGSPLAGAPDPTGEAVVNGDRFADLENELITIIERMANDSARLERIVSAHIAVTQEKATEVGEPGCEWHQRSGTWVPVHRTTDFSTVWTTPLGVPVAVCSACYQHARRLGRPLTRAEVTHHRTHGRWPREIDPTTKEEVHRFGPDRPDPTSRPAEPDDGKDIWERLNAGHASNAEKRGESDTAGPSNTGPPIPVAAGDA